jgi:hypothetical protein
MKRKTTISFLTACLLFLMSFVITSAFADTRYADATNGNNATPVAGVIYVKDGATGTGTSWDSPTGDLQAAINSAEGGQQVWVAKGAYKRLNSGEYFRMKDNVKIYGGFRGDETSDTQRDLTNTAHASILQGNGTHVVYNNGENVQSSALLDGFTITGGSGQFGGGIRNYSASPTIRNCIITNNEVSLHGAGMYNASASPILINCIFKDNRAGSLGGGVYHTATDTRFTNCSFSNNTAVNGAGIFSTGSSNIMVTNCTIAGNIASNGTGGILNNSSTLVVRNSIVYGNSSGINVGDIQYSLVQGMTGTDNHNLSGDTDPLFVNPASGDYRLQLCSPVINKGSNSFYASGQTPDLTAITTDLAGNPRFYNNGIVDMGTYELEYGTTIIYVKAGGVGPGTSWDCAAGDLQGAINSANTGDEVWVAGGTYGRTVAPAYYTMKEGVKIYGGFEGNETGLAHRDLTNTSNTSTLQGYANSVVRNEKNDLTPAAVLDGFTVSRGMGGGVYNSSASPTFRNCIITGNSATATGDLGGGMYNVSSSPVLINCIISGNTATVGGGMYSEGGSPVLINCTISGNTDIVGGGGIYNASSSPKLRNTIVYGNSSGIFNSDSSPDIRYSLIQGINNTDNGNISGDTDPLFVDAANGNYRLRACSPVVNKGSNDYYREIRGQSPDLSHVKTDLEGQARFYNNGMVDIGAYEYQGVSPTTSTIHVDASVATPGNGESWATAIPSLAEAIRVADKSCVSINKILVAEGTYYPEYKAGNGTSERHKAFTITRKGLELLGGYPAGGNGARNPDAHPTIMSGDLGTPGDNSDNAYHVLITVGSGIDESLKLDGFTVRDGNADGGVNDFISVNGFNFVGNARCGGWCNVYGSPQVNGMKITNNRSAYIGGGVLNEGGSPAVTNTIISDNSAEYGGGWYNYPGNPILNNVVIRGNFAPFGGGGWYNNGGDPFVQNVLISGNTATWGAAAWFTDSGNPFLLNCTVTGNVAGLQGISIFPGTLGTTNVRNSIIWEPIDYGSGDFSAHISYANSIVKGSGGSTNWNSSLGIDQGGNLDSDPLFVNPTAGDCRLQSCSPAINTGNTSWITDQSVPDLAGNARIIGANVDMGAYEFAGSPSVPALAADQNEFTGGIAENNTLAVNGSPCTVIAYVSPNGSSPVSGEVSAKVWVESTQPAKFVKRHYQITPTTSAETASAKVTLYFTQQEFTDFNAVNSTKLPINAADTEDCKKNLRIEKRPGTSDDDTGLPGSYDGEAATINPLDPTVNGSITWNTWASRWEVSFDVTGFSGFFVKTIDSPLPLNLLSFTGTKEADANLLTWKTAAEKGFSHFEIEHSTNARAFASVGSIKGGQAGSYSFTHRPAPAPVSYYRLRMVDTDGSFAYSRIVSLHGADTGAIAGNLFPNPVNGINPILDVTVSEASIWESGVYTLNGVRLKHTHTALKPRENRLVIDVKGLPPGVYVVRLKNMQQEIIRKLVVE